ncbi:hypothetical protein U1Q18_024093 [Sarracenia purpurea var. burkii]
MFGLVLSATSTEEHILGMSLLLLFFFFFFFCGVVTNDASFFFSDLSPHPNSSWLKCSISFITRDPTVPLVPICTGDLAAISSGIGVAIVLDLYFFSPIVGGKVEACG